MKRYDPKTLEPKWQKIWDQDQTYKADLDSKKPKFFAMSMFNYPSGAGIHIGHAMNYTISDVKARFKRQSGYESYHPVGWDAFGLPAENYAIKAGVSPQESMAKIIPDYHKQYKAMGWSNDWSKEIATHQPEYYRWTQWIFIQMYKKGLAYQDARMQWWCEQCQTVLANEQIIDGKCWRHDGKDDPLVKQKEVKQWFFKITDYADELLNAIDDLDWTESVKLAQKNWIGKSKGAEISFEINESGRKSGGSEFIKVFTTRPDTLFGASFLVLAPENQIVEQITTPEQKSEVEAYVNETKRRTEVDRLSAKEKTGIFTGAYALNPANNKSIPIWIADYVLTGYGTGAIMAVPAHDERDNEFARKYNLPITRVIDNDAPDDECTHEEGLLMNSDTYNGMKSSDAREKIVTDLAKKDIATEKTNYKMRDWSVSRQRYWGAPIPVVYCPTDGIVLDENLPVVLPELRDFKPSGDGRSALARANDWIKVACPKCGQPAERETDTLDTYICSSWYMLRYTDPHNDQKAFSSERANHWMPVDFYNGGDHATAHMLYARFITRFFHKLGLVDNPEPFKQFLFNGKVRASDGTAFSKSKGNGVDPLEIIAQGYGADALRTYLMFAAPLEFNANWDPTGVPATYRFLNRLHTLTQEYLLAKDGELDSEIAKKLQFITHSVVKKVSEDIEANRYNTAISTLMKCINDLYLLKKDYLVKSKEWQEAIEAAIVCVAPFAPHVSEELWHDLGHDSSVHKDSWPVHDERYLQTEEVTVVVQINGKLKGQISMPPDTPEEEVVKAAQTDFKIAKSLETKTIKKAIYIKNRLVNFVV